MFRLTEKDGQIKADIVEKKIECQKEVSCQFSNR
jgi:hypothetical protein